MAYLALCQYRLGLLSQVHHHDDQEKKVLNVKSEEFLSVLESRASKGSNDINSLTSLTCITM